MTLHSESVVSIPNMTIETGGLVRQNISAKLTVTNQLVMAPHAEGGIKIGAY